MFVTRFIQKLSQNNLFLQLKKLKLSFCLGHSPARKIISRVRKSMETTVFNFCIFFALCNNEREIFLSYKFPLESCKVVNSTHHLQSCSSEESIVVVTPLTKSIERTIDLIWFYFLIQYTLRARLFLKIDDVIFLYEAREENNFSNYCTRSIYIFVSAKRFEFSCCCSNQGSEKHREEILFEKNRS